MASAARPRAHPPCRALGLALALCLALATGKTAAQPSPSPRVASSPSPRVAASPSPRVVPSPSPRPPSPSPVAAPSPSPAPADICSAPATGQRYWGSGFPAGNPLGGVPADALPTLDASSPAVCSEQCRTEVRCRIWVYVNLKCYRAITGYTGTNTTAGFTSGNCTHALAASPSPRVAASPSPRVAPSPSPRVAPSPSPRVAPSPSPVVAPSPSPRPPSPSPRTPSPSPAKPSASPRVASSPSPRLLPSPSPAPPEPMCDAVHSVAASAQHSCVLFVNTSLACWGTNEYGQLGRDPAAVRFSAVPLLVPGLVGVKAVTAGSSHTCVALVDGTAWCFGHGAAVGDGSTSNTATPTPVRVAGLGDVFVTDIVSRYGTTCVMLLGGSARCWGSASYGQLGNGATEYSRVPVDVALPAGSVRHISPGEGHTCAVLADASVWCWGKNNMGELGTGASTESPILTPVMVLASGVLDVAACGPHTCALLVGGSVTCWGTNSVGQLGDGTTATTLLAGTSRVTGVSNAHSIACAGIYTCLLLHDGSARCFGFGIYGQLGNGGTVSQPLPVAVLGLGGARRLAAGQSHACAVLVTGRVVCWGENYYYTLGDGTRDNSARPVNVSSVSTADAACAPECGSANSCGQVRCSTSPGPAPAWTQGWLNAEGTYAGHVATAPCLSQPGCGPVAGTHAPTVLCGSSGTWGQIEGACSCPTCASNPMDHAPSWTVGWQGCIGLQAGSTCTAPCLTNPGCSAAPGSHAPSAECLPDGTWGPILGACTCSVCYGMPTGSTPAFSNGWPASCSGLAVGQSCVAQCSSPCTPGPAGPPTSLCSASGWSAVQGSCGCAPCNTEPTATPPPYTDGWVGCIGLAVGGACQAPCSSTAQPAAGTTAPRAVCAPGGVWMRSGGCEPKPGCTTNPTASAPACTTGWANCYGRAINERCSAPCASPGCVPAASSTAPTAVCMAGGGWAVTGACVPAAVTGGCRITTINAPPLYIKPAPCWAAEPAGAARDYPILRCQRFQWTGAKSRGDCSAFGVTPDARQCWIEVDFTPPGAAAPLHGWVRMADTTTGDPAPNDVCGPAQVEADGWTRKVYVGMCENDECAAAITATCPAAVLTNSALLVATSAASMVVAAGAQAAASVDSCCAACTATPGCAGFTYVPAGSAGSAGCVLAQPAAASQPLVPSDLMLQGGVSGFASGLMPAFITAPKALPGTVRLSFPYVSNACPLLGPAQLDELHASINAWLLSLEPLSPGLDTNKTQTCTAAAPPGRRRLLPFYTLGLDHALSTELDSKKWADDAIYSLAAKGIVNPIEGTNPWGERMKALIQQYFSNDRSQLYFSWPHDLPTTLWMAFSVEAFSPFRFRVGNPMPATVDWESPDTLQLQVTFATCVYRLNMMGDFESDEWVSRIESVAWITVLFTDFEATCWAVPVGQPTVLRYFFGDASPDAGASSMYAYTSWVGGFRRGGDTVLHEEPQVVASLFAGGDGSSTCRRVAGDPDGSGVLQMHSQPCEGSHEMDVGVPIGEEVSYGVHLGNWAYDPGLCGGLYSNFNWVLVSRDNGQVGWVPSGDRAAPARAFLTYC